MTALQTLISKLKEAREKANSSYESEDFNSTLLISGVTGDFGFEMHKCDRDFIARVANELPKLLKLIELQDKALEKIGCQWSHSLEICTRCEALAEVARICGDETPEGNL